MDIEAIIAFCNRKRQLLTKGKAFENCLIEYVSTLIVYLSTDNEHYSLLGIDLLAKDNVLITVKLLIGRILIAPLQTENVYSCNEIADTILTQSKK